MRHLVILAKSALTAANDMFSALTNALIRETPTVVKSVVEIRKELIAAAEAEGLPSVVASTTETMVRYNGAVQSLTKQLKGAVGKPALFSVKNVVSE